MIHNFDAGPFFENASLWMLLEVLESTGDGKFSLAAPLVTGWVPSIIGFIMVILDIVFNAWFMNWWAEGNFYLILTTVYDIWGFTFMLMSVWNWDFYLYDMRIGRYLVAAWALLFNTFYISLIPIEIDLIWIKTDWEKILLGNT